MKVFRIEFHSYNHNDTQGEVLKEIQDLKRIIMSSIEQFEVALGKIDAETTRIGDYIQALTAQLGRTDLTAEQESAVLSALNAAGDRLKGIGTSVASPVPTDELPSVPV